MPDTTAVAASANPTEQDALASSLSAAGTLLVRLVAHAEPAVDVLLACENTCRLPTDNRGVDPRDL